MPQLIFYLLIVIFLGLNAIAKWLSKGVQSSNSYLRYIVRTIMVLTILFSIGYASYVYTSRDGRAFEKLMKSATIEKAQSFITQYPNSTKIAEVQSWINKQYETELQSATDSLSLSNFICKYSNDYQFHEKYKQPFLKRAIELLNKEKQRLEKERNERMRKERLLWISEAKAWQTASKAGTLDMYRKYLKLYPDGLHSSQAKKKVIDLEVANVFYSNNYGRLPSMDKTGYGVGTYTTVTVKNDTQYILTLLYSGIESQRIIITAYSSKNIRLKSGTYRIVASVNATRVQNFAGTENLTGGEYSVSYYIQTSRY